MEIQLIDLSFLAKQTMLVVLLASAIAAQLTATSATSTTSTEIARASPVLACDPYLAICDGACSAPSTFGRVNTISPTVGSLTYLVGRPINVTWAYSSTSSPNYPVAGVSIYYQAVSASNVWIPWGSAPRNSTSILLTLASVSSGSYQVLYT